MKRPVIIDQAEMDLPRVRLGSSQRRRANKEMFMAPALERLKANPEDLGARWLLARTNAFWTNRSLGMPREDQLLPAVLGEDFLTCGRGGKTRRMYHMEWGANPIVHRGSKDRDPEEPRLVRGAPGRDHRPEREPAEKGVDRVPDIRKFDRHLPRYKTPHCDPANPSDDHDCEWCGFDLNDPTNQCFTEGCPRPATENVTWWDEPGRSEMYCSDCAKKVNADEPSYDDYWDEKDDPCFGDY